MTYTNIIYIYIWNISTTTSSTTSAKDGIRPHGPLSRAAASPSQASRVKSYGSSAPVPVVATSRIHSISTYGMTRRTQASQLMQSIAKLKFQGSAHHWIVMLQLYSYIFVLQKFLHISDAFERKREAVSFQCWNLTHKPKADISQIQVLSGKGFVRSKYFDICSLSK